MTSARFIVCRLAGFFLLIVSLTRCNQPDRANNVEPSPVVAHKKVNAPVKQRVAISYEKVNAKQWIKLHGRDSLLPIIPAVNRTDSANIALLDSILIPVMLTAEPENYFPFPFEVKALEDIPKIIFFSYPAQAFGAYENGRLVYAGPTNMGRKKDTTPTGLFFTNWKAEETTSTFNDEWNLKWNFNIKNKDGIGWHQYAMPGYPASHSCLRLLEKDARYLYDWADQWVLDSVENVLANGTPVIVFGSYPFGKKRPWLKLAEDAHALDISTQELEGLATPFLSEISRQRQRREAALAAKK